MFGAQTSNLEDKNYDSVAFFYAHSIWSLNGVNLADRLHTRDFIHLHVPSNVHLGYAIVRCRI